jgi:hypothetical protein
MDFEAIERVLRDWGAIISVTIPTAVLLGLAVRRFGISFFSPAIAEELAALRKTMAGSFSEQQRALGNIQTVQAEQTANFGCMWSVVKQHGERLKKLESK